MWTKGATPRYGAPIVRPAVGIKCSAGLVLLLFVLPVVSLAQWSYTTNNGAIIITDYTGQASDVTIPNTIDGLPVVSIGNGAFYENTNLTAVTIPIGITNVGSFGFYHCTNLSSVTIGDSVTDIGYYAFAQCTGLTSVTIPNSVTNIARAAFSYCTSLTGITVESLNAYYSSVDGVLFDEGTNTLIQYPAGKAGNYSVPSTVTNLAYSAFASCYSLTSVTIPDGAIGIGTQAFYFCISLTNVTIPDSVISIGRQAFYFCNRLTGVTLGERVANIGDEAFGQCSFLTAITVDPRNAFYCSVNGVLFTKDLTALIKYPEAKSGDYAIPKGVTKIVDWAFVSCSSLASVTIPDGVTSIGDSAFYSCAKLIRVSMGEGVTSIGDYAFFFCTSLTTVTIPNSVTTIGNAAFRYCTSLTGVYFKGNTPNLGGSDVFLSANKATVYYLPGTAGWGQTFGGRPTALWVRPNPLILEFGSSFGIRSNQFGFVISWATNVPVVVQACLNLDNPNWSTVSTNTLINGSSYFSDPHWTNYPARFYRLRWP